MRRPKLGDKVAYYPSDKYTQTYFFTGKLWAINDRNGFPKVADQADQVYLTCRWYEDQHSLEE